MSGRRLTWKGRQWTIRQCETVTALADGQQPHAAPQTFATLMKRRIIQYTPQGYRLTKNGMSFARRLSWAKPDPPLPKPPEYFEIYPTCEY